MQLSVTDEEARNFQTAVGNLVPSIETAREAWEFAGKAYENFSGRANWEDHRAAFELILYLASVDYEIKTLLHQFHVDFVNRAVWEKYLGLALCEGIPTVQNFPGLIGTSYDSRVRVLRRLQVFMLPWSSSTPK
jgi:hypothetical protein